MEQDRRTGFLLLERTPAVSKAAERIAAVAIDALDISASSSTQEGDMADDIEAELKAAGKELDKVRHGSTEIRCAADRPPGRGDRAYVGAKRISSACYIFTAH